MSNAAYSHLTDAEIEERKLLLRQWGLDRPKPSADVVSLNAKRRPLGLGIVPGDDDGGDSDEYLGPERTAAKIVAQSIANLSAEQLAAPASMRDIFELAILSSVETSFTAGDDLRDRLRAVRKEIADGQGALRAEIAELKLALTEARCEVREMKAIQESARIASRGEAGPMGVRGIPGPPGEGRTGPAGPPGRDAVAVVAWDVDSARFVITPCHSDGTRGVPLNLLGLFQSYDSAVSEIEDRDLSEAAAASRARTEDEAEEFRQGRR